MHTKISQAEFKLNFKQGKYGKIEIYYRRGYGYIYTFVDNKNGLELTYVVMNTFVHFNIYEFYSKIEKRLKPSDYFQGELDHLVNQITSQKIKDFNKLVKASNKSPYKKYMFDFKKFAEDILKVPEERLELVKK